MKRNFHLPSLYKSQPEPGSLTISDKNGLHNALNQAIGLSSRAGICINKNHQSDCILLSQNGLEINLSSQILKTVGLFDTSLQTPAAIISDYILRSGQLGLKIHHNIKIDKITEKNDLLYLRLKMWRGSQRHETYFEEITGLRVEGSVRRPCKISIIMDVQKINNELSQSISLNRELPSELVTICLSKQFETVKKLSSSLSIILVSNKGLDESIARNIALTASNGEIAAFTSIKCLPIPGPLLDTGEYITKLAAEYIKKGLVFGLKTDKIINKIGYYTKTNHDQEMLSRILMLNQLTK